MPTGTISKTIAIAGINVAAQAQRTDNGQIAQEVTLPAGKAGSLTTRTDDDTGVATLTPGHGITTSDTVDVYWAGGVRYGMPGYPGAIEAIRIEGDRFTCATIGDLPAQGICGSGLVDLVAELRRHGRMTEKGVFHNKQYVLTIDDEQGITFSREDASILAQAKAANTCGQFISMRHFGVRPEEIDRLYLAGGFANYVNAENAIEIGFLAPVAEERIVKIGNAALQGARETLLSQKLRRSLEQDVRDIEHIELETTPDFFDVFVDGCQFKPIDFG